MAVQNQRKKKQSVPVVMFGVLALALIALGTAIWMLVRLGKSDPAAPGNMTPQVAEQTLSSSATEVTTTASTVSTLPADSTAADGSATVTTAVTTTSAAAAASAPATSVTAAPGTVTGISLTFYSTALHVGDKPVMPIVTMTPASAANKQEIWQSSNKAVATVDSLGSITPVGPGDCVVTVTSVSNPAVSAEVKVTVLGSTTQTPQTQPSSGTAPAGRSDIQVINGITYVQGILIANKTYGLPADYNPGLDPTAQAAFNEMAAAAAKDGLSLAICSGFRSYDFQNTLYNNYCNRDGKAAADRFSARPGHSEHQTGLAMDINYAGDSFNNTPEAKWIAENCWKYGFILRYPEGKEAITGYKYESWHVRYLGKDWAKTIYDSGLTLEEYLNIDSKYAE